MNPFRELLLDVAGGLSAYRDNPLYWGNCRFSRPAYSRRIRILVRRIDPQRNCVETVAIGCGLPTRGSVMPAMNARRGKWNQSSDGAKPEESSGSEWRGRKIAGSDPFGADPCRRAGRSTGPSRQPFRRVAAGSPAIGRLRAAACRVDAGTPRAVRRAMENDRHGPSWRPSAKRPRPTSVRRSRASDATSWAIRSSAPAPASER